MIARLRRAVRTRRLFDRRQPASTVVFLGPERRAVSPAALLDEHDVLARSLADLGLVQ